MPIVGSYALGFRVYIGCRDWGLGLSHLLLDKEAPGGKMKWQLVQQLR